MVVYEFVPVCVVLTTEARGNPSLCARRVATAMALPRSLAWTS